MARFAAFLFAACLTVSILGARADTAFTQTAPRPPLPLTSHGKLAAKKEHRESATRKKEPRESAKKKEPRESAGKKQKRAECREQAEKLISDADRRAYMKECMSNL
jgi:hypothetical protein